MEYFKEDIWELSGDGWRVLMEFIMEIVLFDCKLFLWFKVSLKELELEDLISNH